MENNIKVLNYQIKNLSTDLCADFPGSSNQIIFFPLLIIINSLFLFCIKLFSLYFRQERIECPI